MGFFRLESGILEVICIKVYWIRPTLVLGRCPCHWIHSSQLYNQACYQGSDLGADCREWKLLFKGSYTELAT
jgi:hypothetical protein